MAAHIDNRMSIAFSVTAPDAGDRREDTHIPIHFLKEHTPRAIARFASPSSPWPWAGDAEADAENARELGFGSHPPSRFPSPAVSPVRPSGPAHLFHTDNWENYPQYFFPNWDGPVQRRCGLASLFQPDRATRCRIYPVDINTDGKFRQAETVEDNTSMMNPLRPINPVAQFLDGQRDPNIYMRCLCVENLSGDVLKMLGAHYRIEPFFFSSAINRISSRYHEDLPRQKGDHMYITLPFLRVTKQTSPDAVGFDEPEITTAAYEDAVNVFAPLELVGSDRNVKHTLQQDMLAVLVVRTDHNNTIITVHPGPVPHSARTLAHRLMSAGLGVYWGNLLENTHDPIFILLIVMWSAIYAWDEAMAALAIHATYLEGSVIRSNIAKIEHISPKVHAVRAQLLWYDDLLEQFKKSLEFIQKAGPRMPLGTTHERKEEVKQLLKKEIRILMNEVDRLLRQRVMLDERLSHVMKLVVSVLSIKDTRASLLHSESMKQITYLTTIYLPASFIATIYGMNVKEISPDTNGTLMHYFAVMIPLTLVTVWLVGFVTTRVENPNATMLQLIFWPSFLFLDYVTVAYTVLRSAYFQKREDWRDPKDTLKDVAMPLPSPHPKQRLRDPSKTRSQIFDTGGGSVHAVANGHASFNSTPGMSFGGNSSSVLFKQRMRDPTARWDSRPQSVASTLRLSRHNSFEHTPPALPGGHAARSRRPKILETSDVENLPMQPMPAPIITHSPASDHDLHSPHRGPTGGNAAVEYGYGGLGAGDVQLVARRAMMGQEDADTRMLRPIHLTERDFASRSDLGRSEYARSDASTRATTPII